jgi:hypothetical protein
LTCQFYSLESMLIHKKKKKKKKKERIKKIIFEIFILIKKKKSISNQQNYWCSIYWDKSYKNTRDKSYKHSNKSYKMIN